MRLSLRLRLTLLFTLVTAALLAGAGVVLYTQTRAELDASIQRGLCSRMDDIRALVAQADTGLRDAGDSPLTRRGESVAQILDARGRVFDATPLLRKQPLLDSVQLRRALRSTLEVDRRSVPHAAAPVRLLAAPVRAQDRRLVIVTGASLRDRDRALATLRTLLLGGGPLGLLLAAGLGYATAAAALGPVERMRRTAEHISLAQPGARLPVPAGHDEIARLGRTLNAMLDRNEAAFARESAFVADASHELRTPLSVLRAGLDVALLGDAEPDELRDALAAARSETERLCDVTQHLLLLARADHGQLLVAGEPIAVDDLFAQLCDRFTDQLRAQHRTLAVAPSQVAWVVGDRALLLQALSNLVDNAARHGTGDVTLSATTAGDTVELQVRDQGPGFPPTFLPHAFERFTRADPARTGANTGLGLSLVDAILHAHGGHATATNNDRGVTVTLTIPAARPVSSSRASTRVAH